MAGWLQRGCATLAFALAAGCASVPETNYYTLNMTPSQQVPALGATLIVDRLRPSEALARPGIMIKKTPTQIEYYATDHWAANLGELVTQKLQAELGTVQPGAPTLVLSGAILEFSQVDTASGAEAHIQLDLSVRPEGRSIYREPLLRKTYEARGTASAAHAAAVVQALSDGLETVAAEIAKDIAQIDLSAIANGE